MAKIKTNRKYWALAASTLLLTINFWGWSLVSPLAASYAKQYNLSPLFLALLVAAPVAIGSLGRVPIGLLADRYGGRRVFALLCFLSALAVIGLINVKSRASLLGAAVGLGVAGASFAAGVPYVNAWFPKRQRGMALGIYAMGNAGTAIAGLLTPRLDQAVGRPRTFWIVAVLLIIAGLAYGFLGKEASGWKPAKGSPFAQLKQAFAWDLTNRLSLVYAITFGAFITLGLYLPILLNKSYGLAASDAAARAAGFVLLATAIRPLGGWLSDRLSGPAILRLAFLGMAVLAALAATQPSLAGVGTFVYLGLAAALGIGNGAVFAIIGHRCQPGLVGAVTGLVGAAGGIGGYFPPLVMGLSYQLFHSYAAALLLFAAICLFMLFYLKKFLNIGASY